MSSTLCQAQVILRSQPVGTSPVGIWRWSFPRNHLPVAQRGKLRSVPGVRRCQRAFLARTFQVPGAALGVAQKKDRPSAKRPLGPCKTKTSCKGSRTDKTESRKAMTVTSGHAGSRLATSTVQPVSTLQ